MTTAAVKKPRAPRRKNAVAPTDRRTFVGGSDTPGILGLSPWKSAVDVYLEKRGLVDPELGITPEKRAILERGKMLEPYVIEMGIHKLRERGHQVDLIARNTRYQHPTLPWLWVEIDAEVLIDGERVNVDAKTVTGFARAKWGEDDSEDVPMDYACQFMTGLAVTGRRRCLVLALIGLDDVMTFWVHRDEETIGWILPDLQTFWEQHVLRGVPPEPASLSDVKALNPRGNGRTVEATNDIAETVERVRRMGIENSMREAERDELKTQVAGYIGEFDRLTIGAREVATFRAHEETEVDLAAMRRDHPDLVALYERRKTVRVLRFSRKRR